MRRPEGRLGGRAAVLTATAWLMLAPARQAPAQWLPSGPLSLADGRITVAGEASASVAAPEDREYFNYSTASYSLLRLLRLDASAEWRIGSRVSLVGDVRLEGSIGDGGGWAFRPYAAFARFRPWPGRSVAIQAGLIPPVFGTFSRRGYGTDNPLIGIPLAYQYVTTLRPDSLPASADHLLAKRGRGWRLRHEVGSVVSDHGVPLADGLRYPVGVEVFGSRGVVEAGLALTSGSLSESWGRERAEGLRVSARVAIRPVTGMVLGASGSRSGFITRSLEKAVALTAGDTASGQAAIGFDGEYSRGHWLVRGEALHSRWTIPAFAAPVIDRPLGALAAHLEARYRLFPGFYLAARVERIGFSMLTGSGHVTLPWDAPVRRFEIGGGYSLARNVLLKAAYQHNSRAAEPEVSTGLASVQLLAWF